MTESMSENPLISVVIPTYNRVHTISRAIKSVLAQTYSNWELLIVDDGSTDGTKGILDEYLVDSRVSYFSTKNLGAPHARNLGINKAKGDFVALLDSDDEYTSTHLEGQLNAMRGGNFLCSISNCMVVKDGRLVHTEDVASQVLTADIILRGKIKTSASVFLLDRGLAQEIGFDESLASGQDLDFMLRILKQYRILFVGDKLTKIHKTLAYHRISTDFKKKIEATQLLLRKLEEGRYGLSPVEVDTARNNFYYLLGNSAFLAGEWDAAIYWLRLFRGPGFSRRLQSIIIRTTSHLPVARSLLASMIRFAWRFAVA